jgi:predicted negative regulator of RcsB-dependent stress response
MSNERIEKARELVAKFPGNDLARFSLAQALVDAGDLAGAREHLRPLCEKKSDWMVAHILLGKCLAATGEAVEARQVWEHAHGLAVAQHHDGPREELEELLRTLPAPK